MNAFNNVEVGQVFWYAFTSRRVGDRKQFPVRVTKVGRRWITVSEVDSPYSWEVRFDRATGRVDGGTYDSHGDIFTNQAFYELGLMRDRQWREIRDMASRAMSRPIRLSDDDLDRIHTLLELATT